MPAQTTPTTSPTPLHIVADPNNLPFSNEKQEGFENKLAQLLAHDLHTTVDYNWYAQRRGYVRNAIRHGDSDVVLGVPHDYDPLLTTIPYYRSSYVFVSRTDRHLADLSSLDDPRLHHLKIGVQLVGKSDASSPPGMALGRRGLAANVVGFSVYADYRLPNPPARIIDAVADGTVDVALAWGPLAGYFAKRSPTPLTLTPIAEDHDGPYPLAFDISVGVKRSQKDLRNKLNQILAARRNDIDQLLTAYNIPHTLPPPPAAPSAPPATPPTGKAQGLQSLGLVPSPGTPGQGQGEGSAPRATVPTAPSPAQARPSHQPAPSIR